MDAADLLRTARSTAGLTLDELAERAGTSRSALIAYEKGRRDPTVGTLRRLLEACGLRYRGRLEPRWAEVDAALAGAGPPTTVAALVDRAPRAVGSELFLAWLVDALDGAGATWCVSGACAALLQGLPVSSAFLDLQVVDDGDALDRFCTGLREAWARPDWGQRIDGPEPDQLRRVPVTTWWVRATVRLRVHVVPTAPAGGVPELLRVALDRQGGEDGDDGEEGGGLPVRPLVLPVLPLVALALEEPAAAELLARAIGAPGTAVVAGGAA